MLEQGQLTIWHSIIMELYLTTQSFVDKDKGMNLPISIMLAIFWRIHERELNWQRTELISQWIKNEPLIRSYLEYKAEKVLTVSSQNI